MIGSVLYVLRPEYPLFVSVHARHRATGGSLQLVQDRTNREGATYTIGHGFLLLPSLFGGVLYARRLCALEYLGRSVVGSSALLLDDPGKAKTKNEWETGGDSCSDVRF